MKTIMMKSPALLPHGGPRDRRELDARRGRFGSILGSAVGGALLGLGWGFSAILSMLAVPAVCAAVAILLTQLGRTGEVSKEAAAH